MEVIVYTHSDVLKHEMGANHPECPERIIAITAALQKAAFAPQLIWKEAPEASQAQLLRVHTTSHIDSLFALAPQKGYVPLDSDTTMNPYTLSAALHAAGAVVAAVDEICKPNPIYKRAFCLVRPPGHHAEPDTAMGFCFFNNIAVGVAHALAQGYCERVAIIDFDVHHGNGTETMFTHEPRVLFWSSFQHPFYPGTFLNNKPAHIHLCPLQNGEGSAVFRNHVTQKLIPLLEDFKPQCIFISAGFDAHHKDPLANINLSAEDYAFITTALCNIADKYAQGRVISTLEGGYHLEAISESAVAHVRQLGLSN